MNPVTAIISQHFGDNPTRYLPASSWIIQTFGNYQPDGHTGIDFACEVGTPVRAVTSGRVLHEGWMPGTYADNPWWVAPAFAGICVVIDHGSFIGIYGHLSETAINKGDWVSEGQVIAKSGNTGGSTGPHLHFEVLPDGYNLNAAFYGRVDPTPYLAAASLGPTGDITTEEDDLSAADVEAIKAHINALILGTYEWGGRKDNPGIANVIIENQKRIDKLPTAIWWGATVERDGKKIPVIQELANVRSEQLGQGEMLVEISENTSVETLSNLVPDAIAQQVIDALAARLAK